ncbi:hypothetical protein AL537_13765 [Vibrio diabolicus]|nr:hypothetical protein AL537_13765 [Vibrio diabolicus]
MWSVDIKWHRPRGLDLFAYVLNNVRFVDGVSSTNKAFKNDSQRLARWVQYLRCYSQVCGSVAHTLTRR